MLLLALGYGDINAGIALRAKVWLCNFPSIFQYLNIIKNASSTCPATLLALSAPLLASGGSFGGIEGGTSAFDAAPLHCESG
ncbi:hypothetical protein E6O75_ATG08598 [Venturia nashicola]|uniref:Uncharacterized protein n=1 Tax=Venturia nashicola TaxID=86259 RepID=A0A4Z1NQT6_9PEZI|nr:hypothetical protein E6O75_ATG08598 [Venturia nashicola]